MLASRDVEEGSIAREDFTSCGDLSARVGSVVGCKRGDILRRQREAFNIGVAFVVGSSAADINLINRYPSGQLLLGIGAKQCRITFIDLAQASLTRQICPTDFPNIGSEAKTFKKRDVQDKAKGFSFRLLRC